MNHYGPFCTAQETPQPGGRGVLPRIWGDIVGMYVSVRVYKFHYILLEWSICVGTAYSAGLEGPLSFAVMAGTQVVDHAACAAPGVYCFLS